MQPSASRPISEKEQLRRDKQSAAALNRQARDQADKACFEPAISGASPQTQYAGLLKKGALPIDQRFAVTVKIAAEFSGLSKTRIYEFLNEGLIEGVTIRGRRLVLVASLIAFVKGEGTPKAAA